MSDILKEILENYHNGTASKEELIALYRLLGKDAESIIDYADATKYEFEISVLSSEVQNELFHSIEEQLFSTKSRIIKFKSYYRYVVAAAITLVLVFFSWIIQFRNSTKYIPTYSNKLVLNNTNPQLLKYIENKTSNVERIELQDHSIVQLFPNSTISFSAPFKSVERSIYLHGKAIFKVAKNKYQPFVVYSGSVSTTALGTKFLVNNFNSYKVRIKLYEGKVWLRKELPNLNGWKKDLILLPGQQLLYDSLGGNSFVSHFELRNRNQNVQLISNNKDYVRQDSVNVSYVEDSTSIRFLQSPLNEVFSILAKKYSKVITWRSVDISKKHFSGIILKGDSIGMIINSISRMNQLDCFFNQDTIHIQKKETRLSDSLKLDNVLILDSIVK